MKVKKYIHSRTVSPPTNIVDRLFKLKSSYDLSRKEEQLVVYDKATKFYSKWGSLVALIKEAYKVKEIDETLLINLIVMYAYDFDIERCENDIDVAIETFGYILNEIDITREIYDYKGEYYGRKD